MRAPLYASSVCVKRFLLQNYGEEGAREALQILKDLLDRDINVADVAMQCTVHLNYSVRLQLINMLIAVASGDGNVDANEINVIRNIEHPILERELYQVLKELGIHTCAESNTRPKGEPYVLY